MPLPAIQNTKYMYNFFQLHTTYDTILVEFFILTLILEINGDLSDNTSFSNPHRWSVNQIYVNIYQNNCLTVISCKIFNAH